MTFKRTLLLVAALIGGAGAVTLIGLHSFTLVIAAQIVIGAAFAFVPPGIAAVIAALSWIFYFVGLLGVLTAVFSYTIKKRGGAKLKKLLADRRIAVMVITVFFWNLANAVVQRRSGRPHAEFLAQYSGPANGPHRYLLVVIIELQRIPGLEAQPIPDALKKNDAPCRIDRYFLLHEPFYHAIWHAAAPNRCEEKSAHRSWGLILPCRRGPARRQKGTRQRHCHGVDGLGFQKGLVHIRSGALTPSSLRELASTVLVASARPRRAAESSASSPSTLQAP